MYIEGAIRKENVLHIHILFRSSPATALSHIFENWNGTDNQKAVGVVGFEYIWADVESRILDWND